MRPLRFCVVLVAMLVALFVVGGPDLAASQARHGAAGASTGRSGRASAGRPRRGRRPNSTSIGLAFHGRLQRGVLLEESANVRYAGEYRAGGNFFGTAELVALIEAAAAHVARRLPGARLSVGELSRRTGGALSGHRSHQNGRDVDIAFYMRDGRGRPYAPFAFASFDRNGHGLAPNEGLVFDDERNWELIARLVSDADARVQFVFVAETLKQRLLRAGRRRRAPGRVLARAEAVMVQPTHGHPHRNHFHVRIYCPPGDRPRCEDREPFHAWYPGSPPTARARGDAED